ncbi:MAG: hypothetical protein NT144_13105 [Bacteroidia bacterium]|nr:hypothetical protein [Bacteroidia bacterium]
METINDYFRARPVLGVLTLLVCLLSGCASVKIYSRSDLTGETGLKFYTVKPYLLVETNAEKDNLVKTTVVYLPDLANPQYLVLKPGIGSNELKLGFTNGSLSSYGVLTESQISETINSLAALASKWTWAANQLGQPGISPKQSSSDTNFKLFEIIIGAGETVLKEVTIGSR